MLASVFWLPRNRNRYRDRNRRPPGQEPNAPTVLGPGRFGDPIPISIWMAPNSFLCRRSMRSRPGAHHPGRRTRVDRPAGAVTPVLAPHPVAPGPPGAGRRIARLRIYACSGGESTRVTVSQPNTRTSAASAGRHGSARTRSARARDHVGPRKPTCLRTAAEIRRPRSLAVA